MDPPVAQTEDAIAVTNAVDPSRAASVQETLARVQARLDAENPEAESTEEPEAAPKEAKPEPKAKPKANTEAEKDAAEEVTPRDYTRGLAEVRARYARKDEARVQEFAQKQQAFSQTLEKYRPLHEAAEAFDAGDLDGLAEALAKYKGDASIKNWNDLQQAALQSHANPAIREVRKLRREREEEKQRGIEAQKQQAAQIHQQQQAQMAQQWQDSIADELTSDDDGALPAILEAEPSFTAWVFAEQRAHYEKNDGDVLPTKEAATKALSKLYEKLQLWTGIIESHKDSPFIKKILGDQAAAKKPASGSGNRNAAKGKATAKVPPAVSQNRTAEASAYGRPSDDDLIRKFGQQMDADAKSDPMFRRVG